ncbi:MAG: hypothetical protein JXB07_06485 [Anaerolineae bacterium]|nr:hypothetical protein [Anaerolineae bacterium]
MGPGHFGIAFAAKPAAPKVPLWVLLVASEALDLLCFGFVTIGIEKVGASQTDLSWGVTVLVPASIPWSHGLFMSAIWSAVAGGIAYLVFRERRTSAVVGLVVFSHWILDFIVHLPDLPLLFDGSPKVGLGLWAIGAGVVISGILEIALLAGGVVLYVKKRTPRKGKGKGSDHPHQG